MDSYLKKLCSAVEFAKVRLSERGVWKSKKIRYQFPHVDRLMVPWGDLRISLHYIHPCEKSECYIHPHPWPSAIRVLSGIYETGLYSRPWFGLQKDSTPEIRFSGSRGFDYEMVDPNSSHYVWTATGSYSLMVMGPKWEGVLPNPQQEPEGPLSMTEEEELLQIFSFLLDG